MAMRSLPRQAAVPLPRDGIVKTVIPKNNT